MVGEKTTSFGPGALTLFTTLFLLFFDASATSFLVIVEEGYPFPRDRNEFRRCEDYSNFCFFIFCLSWGQRQVPPSSIYDDTQPGKIRVAQTIFGIIVSPSTAENYTTLSSVLMLRD